MWGRRINNGTGRKKIEDSKGLGKGNGREKEGMWWYEGRKIKTLEKEESRKTPQIPLHLFCLFVLLIEEQWLNKENVAVPTKNFSSPGWGNRRTRGKHDEQHKRSKKTPKSYALTPGLATSRRESAEEQGLRRILDPGKVMQLHMKTTGKCLLQTLILLATAYKFDFHSNTFLRTLTATGLDWLLIVHSPSPGISGLGE